MKKLLTTLRRRTADNCFILTFNTDLPFFERMLFEPLYGAGCRNTVIICDPAQYQLSLQDTAALMYAGQRYLLLPSRTSPNAAFHPKLIFLTSDAGGSLFIGSSNLSRSGFTHNWEVFTEFQYSLRDPDPTSLRACKWAYETLRHLALSTSMKPILEQRLDQLWGTTRWLRQETLGIESSKLWLLHNLDERLWTQFTKLYRRLDGSSVSKAVIVSPYFDRKGAVISAIQEQLSPSRIELFTFGNEHGLSVAQLEQLGTQLTSQFAAYDLLLEGRRLHAKALLLMTAKGVWLVAGSANLSRPAWLLSAADGNTEVVTVRFEAESKYFDSWLEELIQHAAPLSIVPEESEEEEPTQREEPTAISLLSAQLSQSQLVLHIVGPLDQRQMLELELVGERKERISYRNWVQDNDLSISLELPTRFLPLLEKPTLIALRLDSGSGSVRSNPVLVHNLTMLKRFSRPLQRRERPSVPEGLAPDDQAQYVEIMDMLYGLLATNQEQLRRHRGRIANAEKRAREEEELVAEDEDYNPDDYLVPERIEIAQISEGADLYADYYDRLTYQDLLRAALAAVYQTPIVPAGPSDQLDPDGEKPPPAQPPSHHPQTLEAIKKRLRKGFGRLVTNFVNGTEDDEYLDSVPPAYLAELFVIITAYLRVVRRDKILDDDPFVELSQELLFSFWGTLANPGAWKRVSTNLSAAELDTLEERLQLTAQAWLHSYVVSELLEQRREQQNDRSFYDFAMWIRHFSANHAKPGVLYSLSEQTYFRLWRMNFSVSVEVMPSNEVIATLERVGTMYDDRSLVAELNSHPATRAEVKESATAGIANVPELRVRIPIDEPRLDEYFRTFVKFLNHPQPKRIGRASFENTNPRTSSDAVRQVAMYYRQDRSSFSFAVEREAGYWDPDIDNPRVTREKLCSASSVWELEAGH